MVFFATVTLPLIAQAGGIKADYLTFRSARPPLAYVEIYFSVSNSLLHFVKTEKDKYQAYIEVLVNVNSPEQNKNISKRMVKKISSRYYHATRDDEINNIFKFPMKLMPGYYETIITMYDKNNDHRYAAEMMMHVPDYSDSFSVSSLRISRVKNDENVFNPDLTFGFVHQEADIYFETYNIDSDLLHTEIIILTPQGNVVQSIAQMVRIYRNQVAFEMPLSLADLAMGPYKIRVVQRRPEDGRQAFSEKQIFVLQSPINLRFKNYQTALDEIRYLISEQEYERMLKVPPEEQQQTLLDFWREKDPTPETAKNEAMLEYYSRMYEANRFFHSSSLPGWQTDFGFIYVLFGPPDEILRFYRRDRFEERHVWRYKKLNLSFTFINWHNYNIYTLLDKKNITARFVPNY